MRVEVGGTVPACGHQAIHQSAGLGLRAGGDGSPSLPASADGPRARGEALGTVEDAPASLFPWCSPGGLGSGSPSSPGARPVLRFTAARGFLPPWGLRMKALFPFVSFVTVPFQRGFKMLRTLAFCGERRGAGLASRPPWPWCPLGDRGGDSWPACRLAHWVELLGGGTTGDCGQVSATTQALKPGGGPGRLLGSLAATLAGGVRI